MERFVSLIDLLGSSRTPIHHWWKNMRRTGDGNSIKRCFLPEIWKTSRFFREHSWKTSNLKFMSSFFSPAISFPELCLISQKNSRGLRFPAKSPDSWKNFVFLPKKALLELSSPVEGIPWGCWQHSPIYTSTTWPALTDYHVGQLFLAYNFTLC